MLGYLINITFSHFALGILERKKFQPSLILDLCATFWLELRHLNVPQWTLCEREFSVPCSRSRFSHLKFSKNQEDPSRINTFSKPGQNL